MITLERKKIVCHIVVAGIADLVMLHRWAGATALHGVLSANGGTGADLPFLCSVVVSRCLILSSGLLIVTSFAERTPIAPVPEKLLVSAMRNDMVNDRSFSEEALLLTHDT